MGIASIIRRSSLSNPDRWLIRGIQGSTGAAGVDVDEDSALSLSALFAGVRIISETYGSTPVKYYEHTDEGRREVRDHPTWRLLHDWPNDEQTPMEFGEMVVGFCILSGNGYAEIVRDGNGRGVEMWPIPSYRVTPLRQNGHLIYRVTQPAGQPDRLVPHEDMYALRGFTRDGVAGLNVVDTMREPIGLAMALDRYAATYFGNGAQPGGLLEAPNKLGVEGRKNLKESWESRHKGSDKAHRIAVLEEGVKWIQTQTDPEKSQLLPLRKYSIAEAARILNMPPHMLKDLERSTNNNIEHQSLEFITGTMRTWFVRGAQAMEKKLILPSQMGRYYIEHTIEALMVGDMKTQSEYFATLRQNGLLNANEIRGKMNLNRYDGGDEYLVQVNMAPARLLPKMYEQGDEPADDTARSIRSRMSASCLPLFRDAMSRIVRAETGGVRKALRKSNGGGDAVAFRSAVDALYADHAGFATRAVLPAAQAYADIIADKPVRDLAPSGGVAGRLAELRAAIAAGPEDIEERVSRLLDEWEGNIGEIARREMGAIAEAVNHLSQGRAA